MGERCATGVVGWLRHWVGNAESESSLLEDGVLALESAEHVAQILVLSSLGFSLGFKLGDPILELRDHQENVE